jgi:hypothetical protein
MRYRYHYATFTRAFSKSFLSILALYLSCIFLPGRKVFICADVKGQAVQIAKEKVNELWGLFPLLKNELMSHNMSNDYITLTFKNGSIFDVVGVANSTRGGRRHGGLIEEAAQIDGDDLNEVVLPLMNINRRDALGRMNPDEPHQQQIYVTTAGPKATFAYEKLIETTIMAVVNPESAFVWGGDYRVPVMHGLLSKKYIDEIKLSSTYKEDSFAREYMSRWTGGSNESWFDDDKLNKHRKLLRAERKYKIVGENSEAFYILSIDVGRFGAQSVVCVFKVMPTKDHFRKNLVNIVVMTDTHFNEQATIIKRMIKEYDPKEVVIDGNGVGAGLVDILIMPNMDTYTGETLAALGVINDENYVNLRLPDTKKILYVLKANSALNSEIHSNCYTQVSSGAVNFLVSERVARAKLMATKKGQKMKPEERNKILMPYEMTSRLLDEMLNLRVKPKVTGIEVEQIARRVPKDKFSAFEYGLYRIKFYEDAYYKQKIRQARNIGSYMAFTPSDRREQHNNKRVYRDKARASRKRR